MAIRVAAGKDAKIGIKGKNAGSTYGTGFLYLAEMSADSNLSYSADIVDQEVYGGDKKVIASSDTGTFEGTAFVSNTTGMVHRIAVTTGGTGYTSAPTVVIPAPPAGGVQATAIAEIAGAVVVGVWMTHFGEGYTSAPAITFTGGAGTGAAATASFGGITDRQLYDLFKPGLLEIEFSPNGGIAASKKTKYTFDFTRSEFSIEPAVGGVISVPFSGSVSNIVVTEW